MVTVSVDTAELVGVLLEVANVSVRPGKSSLFFRLGGDFAKGFGVVGAQQLGAARLLRVMVLGRRVVLIL